MNIFNFISIFSNKSQQSVGKLNKDSKLYNIFLEIPKKQVGEPANQLTKDMWPNSRNKVGIRT